MSIPFPIGSCNIVEACLLPGFSEIPRNGDLASVRTGLWCSMLYYDEKGILQGRRGRTSALTELKLCEGCCCEARTEIPSSLQWLREGESMAAKISLKTEVDSYSDESMMPASGAELGQELQPDPNRPNLIIEAPLPEDTLWTLAKRCSSTADSICKANGLKPGPPENGKKLLIPVL